MGCQGITLILSVAADRVQRKQQKRPAGNERPAKKAAAATPRKGGGGESEVLVNGCPLGPEDAKLQMVLERLLDPSRNDLSVKV